MRLIFIRHPKTEANEKKLVYGRMDALYSQAGEATIPDILKALCRVDVDRIYASPLTRTRILAERLAEDHGILESEICMDERILEMDFGSFEGMTISELEEAYPTEYHEYINNFNDYEVPGGESYRQLYQRVGEFLKEIYQRHEGCRMQKETGAQAPSNKQKTPDALELELGEDDGDETQQWLNQRGQNHIGSFSPQKEETILVVAHSMVIHAALAHLLNLDLNDVWHIKIEPGTVVDLDWRYDFAMLQALGGPFNIRQAGECKG